MIRNLTILIGVIIFKFSAIIRAIIFFYYKQLYHSNLVVEGKIVFGHYFHLTIEKNASVNIGNGVVFMDNCRVTALNSSLVSIGKGTYFNHGCSITAMAGIKIGENSMFGENVKIYDHNHRFRDKNRLIKNQGFSISEVRIGNNVWIGSNVTILKGTCIRDNCVIGAGCVIYKNIPENSVIQQSFSSYNETSY